jgi:hypothetical protein
MTMWSCILAPSGDSRMGELHGGAHATNQVVPREAPRELLYPCADDKLVGTLAYCAQWLGERGWIQRW